MNRVLIGYRGAGKSAVGRRLADRLGLVFYDTDVLIEEYGGRTIQEMVSAKGWEYFREREKAVIRELSAIDAAVIATGGGAVLDPENVALLKRNGRLIWLIADPQTLITRMQADQGNRKRRPSLAGGDHAGETAALMAARTPYYRAAADWSLDTSGKTVGQLVDEICSQFSL
jgi:shikimate kinase